jgi:xyloglucan-specific exo-beta-1,4-glucanase
VADASDSTGLNSDNQGLAWVTFNSNSTTVGGATGTIFVGVADKQKSVYVSKDAGSSWSLVAGQPTGFLPHKGKLSPKENALYVTYSDGSGPYDGTSGAVYRYDITASTWTNISPGDPTTYGYGGFAVDLQKPGTIMVAALNSWWPDGIMWRSNDSGKTWSPIWDWAGYPVKNNYYSISNTNAPWVPLDPSSLDVKSLGWMIESLEIDPFDSNHWLYGTGLTVFGGHDLVNWDTKHNVSISVLAKGIEETSVQALAAPAGQSMVSAMGDIGGFVHTR